MHASPQHDRQSPPLPEPEVTESDFGAFFDEAEAFCDAEEARATHPDTVAFFARLAEEMISGLRTAHTHGSTTDWQGYAESLAALIRRRLSA